MWQVCIPVCILRPPNTCQWVYSLIPRHVCVSLLPETKVYSYIHSLDLSPLPRCVCMYSLKSSLATQYCDSVRGAHTHTPHTHTQLPSFPHAGLQVAQLLVALVEQLQLAASPAPPDSQAPGHVFVTKAAHNSVLCNQCSFHQRAEKQGGGKRARERERVSEWVSEKDLEMCVNELFFSLEKAGNKQSGLFLETQEALFLELAEKHTCPVPALRDFPSCSVRSTL